MLFDYINPIWLHKNVFTFYGGLFGGGGDVQAPDYTALAAASEKAAQLASDLGNKQLTEAQRQYDLNMAVAKPVVDAQAQLAQQQIAQGNDYYNYGKTYSRPVEQQLYYESMGFTPDEIAQIEASRTREVTAFKANNQPTTTTIQGTPATEGVKGFTPLSFAEWAKTQPSNPSGFVSVPGMINGGYYGAPISPTQAQYQEYLKKNPAVAEVKATAGTPTQVVQNNQAEQVQSTPETDALTAQLGAAAAARQKAADQAERDKLTGLNTNLANRIGESDVDTYLRNKASIDAEADQAVADARNGFTNATNTAIRQGLRYGMSPERIAAAAATNTTAQAQQQASAANATRKAATQTMYQRGVNQAGQLLTGGITERNNKIQDNSIATAKKLDVAGLYRGMPGASQGAYGLSINAGNSAVGNNAQAGNALLNANQGAAGTILQGTGQQISGLSGIVNSQTSIANANAGSDAGIWGALGQIGGAAASKWITSDKKVKKDVKKISDVAALEGIKKTPISRWKYDEKKVQGEDDKEHVGAMAQDLKKNLGSNVSDGKMVDLISAIGVNMAATKALAKQVDKLKGNKK